MDVKMNKQLTGCHTCWHHCLEGRIGQDRTGQDVDGVYDKRKYEGWNFNSDNYLFTTDTK